MTEKQTIRFQVSKAHVNSMNVDLDNSLYPALWHAFSDINLFTKIWVFEKRLSYYLLALFSHSFSQVYFNVVRLTVPQDSTTKQAKMCKTLTYY
jgi:hypothetical protein